MALDTQDSIATYDAPEKDLYEVGEMPPMGYVPKQMYAWGHPPRASGRAETRPCCRKLWTCRRSTANEVLVLVMAAGVNYNGVWAGLGVPISMFDVHKQTLPYCRF